MSKIVYVRQLSSGWWHIRGSCWAEWAQPPAWPCSDEVLDAHWSATACDKFKVAVRAARDVLDDPGPGQFTKAEREWS